MKSTVIEKVQEILTECEQDVMDNIKERNEHPEKDASWQKEIDHVIDLSIEQINDFNEVIEKWKT